MNNNYTIAQRNALVEKYLWCIDTVIRKNRPLMRAAQLEYDDVYQQLALRLIQAVMSWPVLIPRRAHFSSISSHSSNMNYSTASRLTACAA
mgnify:CR=1 FL=1